MSLTGIKSGARARSAVLQDHSREDVLLIAERFAIKMASVNWFEKISPTRFVDCEIDGRGNQRTSRNSKMSGRQVRFPRAFHQLRRPRIILEAPAPARLPDHKCPERRTSARVSQQRLAAFDAGCGLAIAVARAKNTQAKLGRLSRIRHNLPAILGSRGRSLRRKFTNWEGRRS